MNPASVISAVPDSTFASYLYDHRLQLKRGTIDTLQINIGKRCNQACHHCHVEAGPLHQDNMTAETVDRLIALLESAESVDTVDITGGAPEMNPHFQRFVTAIRGMGKTVIDRCNLTILQQPGHENTAEFLAHHKVNVVASLPCYSEANVNQQRGNGVFADSIAALQKLNTLGYGQPGSDLTLDLVYNPLGASLPPPQASLEADYRKRLLADFGIRFHQLYTLTNMPIKRFAHQLQRDKQMVPYMQLLKDNFNPEAAQQVMCRSLVSIGFDGQIYDCDFNQMLDIPVAGKRQSIWDINALAEVNEAIAIDDHCFACTAGAGSSCGGSLVNE